jgi:hypothetical protein
VLVKNRADLIVVANARKSEQFGHELAQPKRILLKMNYAGMEGRSLCRQPHDLVAFELAMVLVGRRFVRSLRNGSGYPEPLSR